MKTVFRVLMLAGLFASTAVAAPFQNGSFEIGTDPGGGFLTLPNGDSTDITGWTVIVGDIDYIGGYWQASQGVRSLDLIGDQFKGGVQQTFDTIPGAPYSLSFDMSGNPDAGPTVRPLDVTVAGTTQSFSFDITGATRANMNWTPHQFTFFATGSSETIQFVSDLSADPNGCCYGAALDNVQIVGLPDLTIAKTHLGNFAQQQVGAIYMVTVTNRGAGPTSGSVSVVDTLPGGLTATNIAGTNWSCVLGTLTCTRADALAAGESYEPIVVTVNVAANAPPSIVNTVTVSGGGDAAPGNNTANDPTTITQLPDLSITKTHVGNFTQGQVGAVYTVMISNGGSGSTSGLVSVVDTLPVGLSATNIAGTNWSCVLGTLTCTRSDVLGAGASYEPITITITVAANAPPSVVNTVTVSGGGDPNPANNTATDTTTITQLPDLTITKTHAGNFAQRQVGATYTVTVSNVGAGPSAGVVSVIDTLPAVLAATGIGGTGWTCVLGTLTCTRSDALAPASGYPVIILTVDVSANAPPSVVNNVIVSGGGDTNPANNTANDTTTITQLPILALTKSHSGSFQRGQSGAMYILSLSNVGSGPTSGAVSVTDTLPGGLNATGIAGSGWSCVLITLTCIRSDVLAAGQAYPPITLTVNVLNNAPSSVTNSAQASGGGAPTTSGNTANDPTQIDAVNVVVVPVPALGALQLALLAALLALGAVIALRGKR